jgi:hypothetical protein
MKGDFSRLPFRPQKHYARVLQQQGRPQLDADWNEQVSILFHRLQTLTSDLVGDAGNRSMAPPDIAGFEITPMAGEANNFAIGAGRYYVSGLCCECEQVTTYAKQPLPTESKLSTDGISLIYLDAWERVVAPLDDPELLEPALSGLETTLRTQIAWQVKTHHLPNAAKAPDLKVLRSKSHEFLSALRSQPRGKLWARLASRPAETGAHQGGKKEDRKKGGHFRGPENLLYRIEVHKGGPAGEATFKWSRENGAPLLPLLRLDGSLAQVVPIARKAASELTPGTWLELSDSLDRALGRSRDMVQVEMVDGLSGRIQLKALLADGEKAEQAGLALRRWDQRSSPQGRQQAGASGLSIVEGDSEAHWLDIEDGIQIQFRAEKAINQHHYRAGDYWLIPARTADEGILLRGHTPEEPDGITHYYAPLALFEPAATQQLLADLRPSFQTLGALQDQVNNLQLQLNAVSDGLKDLRNQIAAPKGPKNG